MVNEKAPENVIVYRKKGLTALGGVVSLLCAAGLIALVTVAYFKTDNIDEEIKTYMIISFTGIAIASAILIINAALCFNNLRYPYILATDEKGLYDYSGFVHCGFMGWEEIERINGGGKKIEAFLDMLADGAPPAVKIDLKNYKLTFANKSRLWKVAFLFSGFGCVRIRTFCSTLSKKNTYALLCERFNYYTANTD